MDVNSLEFHRPLYVFLDEGGNFDFSSSGTPFFTLTSISVQRPFSFDQPLIDLRFDLIEEGQNLEYLHATDDRQAVRDRVFDVIESCPDPIKADSVIVEKGKTHPTLRRLDRFYPRMLGYLLGYVIPHHFDRARHTEVIVITDRIPVQKKRKAVEKAIKKTLADRLPSEIPYRLLHHQSRSCVALQVVDYINWAIQRRWTTGDDRSWCRVASIIQSEFNIFRTGKTRWY